MTLIDTHRGAPAETGVWDAGDVPARWPVRLAVALNVALTVWYFSWLIDLDHANNLWLYGALLVAECFNVMQGAMFWWTVTNDRRHERAPAWTGPLPVVDVFIPVYNEPVDIVEPTIIAATRLQGAHVTVHLLDDGKSDDMARLARRHDVGYIRRSVNKGAKAGNINNALGETSGDFVVVFDCDHVPKSHFLDATMGYFGNDDVAFVQTPQYYANQSDSTIAAASAAQQELFFGVISRGKATRGAMFCCGTNVVFRRSALESVGGFPEDSLTEDFALSVELHERGWESRYVAEVLAVGLGPEDMSSYVSQQMRWAQGCLGGIPRVLRSKLPLRQRLQYLSSGTYFLSGWTVMLYMSLPIMRLVFGVQPIGDVGTDEFLLHFGPYFVASLATVAIASGGAFTFSAFALNSATFWVHIRSLGRVVFRRRGSFVVTPKHGAAGRQLRPIRVTIAFAIALTVAIVVGLARDPSPSTFNNVAYAGLHLVVLACGAWPALVGDSLRPAQLSSVNSAEVAA
ncbi:glycosyltransferase family 2 protein [Ilumatobacter nonamiensis]|uniref:glycosyltransferase family 2 protein n=1 Tax=Ilumatobacter nonamiensis TaxID=467093 RepID=UPI00034DE0B0|nr:glycosyltransferase [Ilumatobacter nonamiensis]